MASSADGKKHEEKRELTPMRSALRPKAVDLSAVVVDLMSSSQILEQGSHDGG